MEHHTDRTALPAGATLGGYTVRKTLSQGAFGITYLVSTADNGATARLFEFMPDGLAVRNPADASVQPGGTSPATAETFTWTQRLFSQGAELLRDIRHPNIAPLQDVVHTAGTTYCVEAPEEGPTITGWVKKKGAPDFHTLRSLILSLLSGLDCLHGNGLLHEDVRPANIAIGKDGEPVLHRCASLFRQIDARTGTRSFPDSFNALEQQEGGAAGPWTDFYALGATLYTILTGTPPPEPSVRLKDLDSYIPLASTPALVARYGKPLLAGIDKALSVIARDRWQSAESWRVALEQVQEAPAPTDAPQREGGGRSKATLLGIVAVIAAGAGLWYLGSSKQAEQPEAGEAPAKQTAAARPAQTTPAPAPATTAPAQKPSLIVSGGTAPTTDINTLRQGAEAGDAAKQCALAFRYIKGDGVEQSDEEAAKWYAKAAGQGDASACFNLALLYETGRGVAPDKEKAVELYKQAAGQGDADAAYNLAQRYMEGTGTARNIEEAIKWYRMAATAGHVLARYNLGLCYLHGTGVEQKFTEAAKWFRLAADQGYPQAEYNLGWCYAAGAGVEQNKVEAAKWYRRAADHGLPAAQEALGKLGK